MQMDLKAFHEILSLCKHPLITRLIHLKGDMHCKFFELKEKLTSIWKLQHQKLIYLEKGYYQVLLYTKEDKFRIWAIGSFSLKPGVLHYKHGILILIWSLKSGLTLKFEFAFMDKIKFISIVKLSQTCQEVLVSYLVLVKQLLQENLATMSVF